MNSKSFLILSSLLILAACAEPDSIESSAPANPNNISEKPGPSTSTGGAAFDILKQKYDKLDLNCNLTAKDKIKGSSGDSIESKTDTFTLNLLQEGNLSSSFALQLSMSNVTTNWQIALSNFQVRFVSYTGAGEAFEADRSPVIDALVSGKLTKPVHQASNSVNSSQIETANLPVQFFENTTTVISENTEGPTQNPELNLQVSCHLEAAPKSQFASEFRRK